MRNLKQLACFTIVLLLGACDQQQVPAPTSSEAKKMPSQEHNLGARITGLSIVQIQAAIRAGDFSVETLTGHYLAEIERKNPELHAIITVNPKALEQARQQDEALADGTGHGLLFGIPIVVKDNIETRFMPTTAGSLALKDNATDRDASVIARLREEGAIILAKTNLSEWANFRSTRSSSGWSAVGGQTRNPVDTSRSTCGSSSGSGAAVAAGLAPGALGTETDGSVVCPSSLTGIVGIKPSVGVVSRKFIVPISHSQDTAGPMAKTVSDAALMLSAMAGVDPQDPVTDNPHNRVQTQYHTNLDANSLAGARIGILRSATGYHEGVDNLFEQAIKALREAGAVIVDDLKFEPPKEFNASSYAVLMYEFKADLNQYFAELPLTSSGDLNQLTLEKLIAFNNQHENEELAWFRQEIFEQSQALGDLNSEEYLQALSLVQQETRENGIDRLMTEHRLAALVAPTTGPAWAIDLVNGDNYLGASSSLAAVSGYPNITVPMGRVHGLPVGLSIIAEQYAEQKIINLAYAFEQLQTQLQYP